MSSFVDYSWRLYHLPASSYSTSLSSAMCFSGLPTRHPHSHKNCPRLRRRLQMYCPRPQQHYHDLLCHPRGQQHPPRLPYFPRKQYYCLTQSAPPSPAVFSSPRKVISPTVTSSSFPEARSHRTV